MGLIFALPKTPPVYHSFIPCRASFIPLNSALFLERVAALGTVSTEPAYKLNYQPNDEDYSMARRSRLVPIVTLVAVFALSACAQRIGLPATPGNDQSGGQPAPAFSQFSDIPIPRGAAMNMERTLVLGSKESWVGRLVISSSQNSTDMFAFFKERAGEFGWQEVTSVRSAISVLTFTRADRVMTIQIQGKTISGSDMDITVAPRESQSIAQGSANVPPMAPLPSRAPVQRLQ